MLRAKLVPCCSRRPNHRHISLLFVVLFSFARSGRVSPLKVVGASSPRNIEKKKVSAFVAFLGATVACRRCFG